MYVTIFAINFCKQCKKCNDKTLSYYNKWINCVYELFSLKNVGCSASLSGKKITCNLENYIKTVTKMIVIAVSA